jgi:hypothetical protein
MGTRKISAEEANYRKWVWLHEQVQNILPSSDGMHQNAKSL